LQVTPFQPFYLYLASELAKCMGDPDWRVLTEGQWSYAKGVPVGVGIRMPRAPAVFERKQAWRNLDETAYEPDSQNYKSAEAALPDLIRQMEEEAPLGMCYECTEEQARKDYPGDALRIAAIGAIEKGDSTFRIIHDGTHGVHVNPQTQPRDRLRMPGPAEQRAIQERAARTKTFHFVLKADVGKAHRRFLNRQEDWGLQACRLRPGYLWVNRVGTFGVGTACYWWGRLAAALDRITWLCCPMEEIWQLIYADDLFWAAAGPTRYTDILAFLLLWVVMGTPIKWKKCQGGIEVEWLGCWVDYGRFQLGISEARAAWLVQWLRRALEQGTVLVSTLVAVLGRLGFAAGVLEWDRPFLGPLYAWTAAVPASAFVRLPVLVRLILEYLAQRLATGLRVIDSALSSRQLGHWDVSSASAALIWDSSRTSSWHHRWRAVRRASCARRASGARPRCTARTPSRAISTAWSGSRRSTHPLAQARSVAGLQPTTAIGETARRQEPVCSRAHEAQGKRRYARRTQPPTPTQRTKLSPAGLEQKAATPGGLSQNGYG